MLQRTIRVLPTGCARCVAPILVVVIPLQSPLTPELVGHVLWWHTMPWPPRGCCTSSSAPSSSAARQDTAPAPREEACRCRRRCRIGARRPGACQCRPVAVLNEYYYNSNIFLEEEFRALKRGSRCVAALPIKVRAAHAAGDPSTPCDRGREATAARRDACRGHRGEHGYNSGTDDGCPRRLCHQCHVLCLK